MILVTTCSGRLVSLIRRPALRRVDENGHQPGQFQRSFGGVGSAAELLDRADLVQYDIGPGQDEGEGQQRRTGVAILERMEEAHVQIGAGCPSGQRHSGGVGLLKAFFEPLLGVVVQPVALPASLGEGESGPEGRVFGSQDVALPPAHGGEVEGAAGGQVGSHYVQGR